MMSIASFIKSNPKVKKWVLWMMIPVHDNKPRWWVRHLINPFKHKRGRGVIIRRRTRRDVFPHNAFTVGAETVIEDFSTINNGVGNVCIGMRSMVGLGNVIIGPVYIGNDVMLAQHIVLSGLNHDYEDVTIPPASQGVSKKPIHIEDNVWIGANSVVTAGVTIGRHSIIGAGSVVTRDIPPFSVAVGNPARVIKQYNNETATWERIH